MADDETPTQLDYMQRLVEMSAERTALSAERSWQNAERTLSVWVRTALALMVFGIAIDRFGLLLREMPARTHAPAVYADGLSRWVGAALVAFGLLMACVTAARFLAYARDYRRRYEPPRKHGAVVAPAFAFLVAGFGALLLAFMIAFAP